MKKSLKRTHVFITFFFAIATSACGNIYTEDRLYGTWVEPLDRGSIEFREDGTLLWAGEVGRFEFVRSSNWASCFGRCADGEVAITLPSGSFRWSVFKSTFDNEPDSLYIAGRNGAGFPVSFPIYGRKIDSVSLFRQGTLEDALMPDYFSRIDTGFEASSSLYRSAYNPARASNGELVAEIEGALYRFEEGPQSWVRLANQDRIETPYLDGTLYRHAYGDTARIPAISDDAGRTWREIPQTSDNELYLKSVGETLVSVREILEEGTEAPKLYEFWVTDLSDDTPVWRKVGETPDGTRLQASPSSNLLTVASYVGDERVMQVSTDFGASWQPFDDRCRLQSYQPHSSGFYCVSWDATLLWFEVEGLRWQEYDLGFELKISHFANVRAPSDAAYLIVDSEVIAWRPSGEERVISLSGDNVRGGGTVYVLPDHILVNNYTVWRAAL